MYLRCDSLQIGSSSDNAVINTNGKAEKNVEDWLFCLSVHGIGYSYETAMQRVPVWASSSRGGLRTLAFILHHAGRHHGTATPVRVRSCCDGPLERVERAVRETRMGHVTGREPTVLEEVRSPWRLAAVNVHENWSGPKWNRMCDVNWYVVI